MVPRHTAKDCNIQKQYPWFESQYRKFLHFSNQQAVHNLSRSPSHCYTQKLRSPLA